MPNEAFYEAQALLNIIDKRQADPSNRDIEDAAAKASVKLRSLHDRSLLPESVRHQIANLGRVSVFGSAIEAVCLFCDRTHSRHANDIIHDAACLWKSSWDRYGNI